MVTVEPKITRSPWGILCDVDHLNIRQFAFDILNPSFSKTLLFTGGMILGILFEIAVLTGRGNGLNNSGSHFFDQVMQVLREGRSHLQLSLGPFALR